jgi:hypothetical protein
VADEKEAGDKKVSGGKAGAWIGKHKAIAYGGVVIVIVILYFILHKSASASTTASTGASSDIDPATGYPTGSAADIAALNGGSGTSSSVPSGGGGGWNGGGGGTTTNNYYTGSGATTTGSTATSPKPIGGVNLSQSGKNTFLNVPNIGQATQFLVSYIGAHKEKVTETVSASSQPIRLGDIGTGTKVSVQALSNGTPVNTQYATTHAKG